MSIARLSLDDDLSINVPPPFELTGAARVRAGSAGDAGSALPSPPAPGSGAGAPSAAVAAVPPPPSPLVVVALRRYTGLANQGATCYMNSLLQTLFMTPEFRRVLYAWRYTRAAAAVAVVDAGAGAGAGADTGAAAASAGSDAGPPADVLGDSIPYQLQLLFGQLQLTSQRAITTTALTRSFGWGGADAFQQHDVQELARVLFDALERSLAGTADCQVINDLFKGTYHDYVRCEECGSERRRTDTFLDLNLAVKPFGAVAALGSVGEALDEFVKAEVMDGSDKVACERCARKTKSVKGLKIAQPPYLLQLLLNRCEAGGRGAWARGARRAARYSKIFRDSARVPLPTPLAPSQLRLRLRDAEPAEAQRPHDVPLAAGPQWLRHGGRRCRVRGARVARRRRRARLRLGCGASLAGRGRGRGDKRRRRY